MREVTQNNAGMLAASAVVIVVIAALGVMTIAAVGPVAGNHGDDGGNYTVVLPDDTDHLPGDQNKENASMQNFAAAGNRFEIDGAPNGFETLDFLKTGSQEIDYSQCGSSNTAVFGIDRGNNNSGTKTDVDLLQHMKKSEFKENGIEVTFYGEEDTFGDPTHTNPEDAIIAVQGAGSSGGPCFTMPSEPGWYQVSGYIEGTTEDGETVRVQSNSHYFPICDGCHDEEYAYEELGSPPGTDEGDNSDEATPTATAAPDEDDETTPTATLESDADESDSEEADDEEADDPAADGSDDEDTGATNQTPTPGDGPGFGALAALFALFVSTVLVHRRG